MTDFMEPPPWAFDGCTAWAAYRTEIEKAGFAFRQVASWRLDDGDATRGDTMRLFEIAEEETDHCHPTCIVQARAQDGFSIWIEEPSRSAGGFAETVRALTRATPNARAGS